jgi:hypothetical protein
VNVVVDTAQLENGPSRGRELTSAAGGGVIAGAAEAASDAAPLPAATWATGRPRRRPRRWPCRPGERWATAPGPRPRGQRGRLPGRLPGDRRAGLPCLGERRVSPPRGEPSELGLARPRCYKG